MEKIKTILIEDVKETVKMLEEMLKKHCPNIEVVGVAGNISQGYDIIVEKQPDLVLFDVQIEGGTGFDIIQKLLDNKVDITFEAVFMTGHKEFDYAAKAFEYSAIHYFPKPFTTEDLVNAIAKVEEKITMVEAKKLLQGLVEVLNDKESFSDYITIHLANKITRKIPINQIVYMVADTIFTDVYLSNGETIKAFRNLGQYRQILELDHNFFSIKNSICVNLDQRQSYDHESYQMTMKNGKVLQGSRDYCKKYYAYTKELGEETKKQKKSVIDILKGFFGI